jgi:Leucine-rich repeat (LRR) protein
MTTLWKPGLPARKGPALALPLFLFLAGCGSHAPEDWQDYTFDRDILASFFAANALPVDSMDAWVDFRYNRAQAIHLRNQDLKLLQVPLSMRELPELISLHVVNSGLIAVPDLRNLPDLSALVLDSNGIDSLPEGFGEASGLRILSLRHNRLRSLPEYWSLPELQDLILADNGLVELSEGMAGLGSLISLTLIDNDFQEFPPVILRLRNLAWLYLSRNRLDTLPEAISLMSSLEILYLDGNELSRLPPGFTTLNIPPPTLPSEYSEGGYPYLNLKDNRLCALSDEEREWADKRQEKSWLATQRCP